MRSLALLALPLALSLSTMGCASQDDDDKTDDALTSDAATFLDFEFDGEVVAPSGVVARQAIITQLYYTEGRLTHLGGNSRPGFVKLKGVRSVAAEDGFQRITYKASLPVLWPAGHEKPADYKLAFPKKVDQASLDAFNAKYDNRCGKNEYGQATFWHDFDPGVQGCTLDDDAVTRTAVVKDSTGAIEGKYPEYDKIFADGVMRNVSVVGLDGWSDQPTDKGVQVFERFVSDMKGMLENAQEDKRPLNGFVLRDVTVKGTLDGNKVEHTFLLVSQMEHADETFDRRFNEVTETADVVTYDGHSGLGKNIQAITSRGIVKKGQYQVWFLDGCNSLGYVDTKFTERRRTENGRTADPDGTKFVDLIGNALPSYWPWDESTSFKLVRSLAHRNQPKDYLAILSEFPDVQVPAVVGDEDNKFRP